MQGSGGVEQQGRRGAERRAEKGEQRKRKGEQRQESGKERRREEESGEDRRAERGARGLHATRDAAPAEC